MPSLDNCFQELLSRLGDESALRSRGEDPVYYLVFPPSEMLAVKRRTAEWVAKLTLDGYDVDVFSARQEIHDVTQNHPLRQFWLKGEEMAGGDYDQVNGTIRQVLVSDEERVGAFERRLLDRLESLRARTRPLLLMTDLEAIHPYMRIGAFEQRLQGKVHSPLVVLYPGTRHGEYSLSFLGLYTVDGNYRSTHIDCQ